jgi:hypothetical protein
LQLKKEGPGLHLPNANQGLPSGTREGAENEFAFLLFQQS